MEKRKIARTRALRAARVVTIAGALLGGCSVSHEVPSDQGADTPFDVGMADQDVPDGMTCPQSVACGCEETTRQCCEQLTDGIDGPASFSPNTDESNVGQCCGVCIGPLAPPELMA